MPSFQVIPVDTFQIRIVGITPKEYGELCTRLDLAVKGEEISSAMRLRGGFLDVKLGTTSLKAVEVVEQFAKDVESGL